MFKRVSLSMSSFMRINCEITLNSMERDAWFITKYLDISSHGFHTTPKRYLHPVMVFVARIFVRTSSIFIGRSLRIGWQKMDSEDKKYYKKKYFHNPLFWTVPISIMTIGGGAFYFWHLQDAPITKRRRFIALDKFKMAHLSNYMLEDILKQNEGKMVKVDNELHSRVLRVIDRLVKSNGDIEQVKSQDWTLHVIDDNIIKAFVLPNGHIFVHAGLLKISGNDDQLAFVLGHEMAHAILSHAAENISFTGMIETVSACLLALIWALLSADLAILVEAIQRKTIKMLLKLPYGRRQELEADEVGLSLIAKACYDVRQSIIFFKNLTVINDVVNENSKRPKTPEFLSTHPSHENRIKELEKFIPAAMVKRKECKCPELNGTPQSFDLESFKTLLKGMKSRTSA